MMQVDALIVLAMVALAGLIGYGVGYSQAASTRWGDDYTVPKRRNRP